MTAKESYKKSAKRKTVGAKIRDNGMAQADWGDVKAPTVRDGKDALRNRAAFLAAKGAKKRKTGK